MTPPQGTENARTFLSALTAEAKAALGGPELELANLPFRVGRESRKITWTGKGIVSEQRDPSIRPNNDIYLIEKGEVMNVSREHFQITRDGSGFALEDRKSTLGTIVEGDTVGGQNKGGRLTLRDGDVIIVGASVSPYVFKFRLR